MEEEEGGVGKGGFVGVEGGGFGRIRGRDSFCAMEDSVKSSVLAITNHPLPSAQCLEAATMFL